MYNIFLWWRLNWYFFFIFMDDLLDHVAIPRKAAWNGVLRAQTKNLDRGMDYGLVKKVLALKI